MSRLQHLLPSLALASVLVPGCAGTPSRGEPRALLITLRNVKTGERLELASESHTTRVDYYSDVRTDAVRKVQSDEVMAALVEELDRHGFARHARTGPAPDAPTRDLVRWSLEIGGQAAKAHWMVGTGSPLEEWKEFQECRDAFLQLYNITVSYQAVENPEGRRFFDERPSQSPAATGQRKLREP